MQGTARGGRITKADVLDHGNGVAAPATPTAAPAETAQLIKGGGAALARYMDQSRSIPTATSFRTITVTTLDERRKQLKAGGQRVSFTHLIAYAIARVATEDMPVMAHHFEEIDGKPGIAMDDAARSTWAWPSTWRRRTARAAQLMVPVIRYDAGRLSFDGFLNAYNALVDKARAPTR